MYIQAACVDGYDKCIFMTDLILCSVFLHVTFKTFADLMQKGWKR